MIIPIYLGSISSPIYPKQHFFFIAHKVSLRYRETEAKAPPLVKRGNFLTKKNMNLGVVLIFLFGVRSSSL